MNTFTVQSSPHASVSVGVVIDFLLLANLLYQVCISFRLPEVLNKIVVTTSRNREETAHDRNRILLPVMIDNMIFNLSPRILSAIHGKDVKPFVKYRVIQRHSGQYLVSIICRFFGVSRSGYYDFLKQKDHPDKDAPIAEMIAGQQEKCFHTYGYRRTWKVLKKKDMIRNPKTILRIMKKYDPLSEI